MLGTCKGNGKQMFIKLAALIRQWSELRLVEFSGTIWVMGIVYCWLGRISRRQEPAPRGLLVDDKTRLLLREWRVLL